MRALLTLAVAAIVVLGTAPIGVGAAGVSDAPSAAIDGPMPAQAQTNGTATSTPSSNTTDADEGTATETEPEPSDTNTSDTNATAGLEPGAQLAGVVGVQGAEVESEVGARAFGQRVAAAASNGSKAAIVAGEVNDSRERLETLRDRLAELKDARESGNISEGRYRAETARVAAEIGAVERRLEQSNETASSLPAAVRENSGINTSSIERLRTEARNLSGPEVAAIARSIGGDRSGRGLGDNTGPPGRSGNASGSGGPPGDTGPPGGAENRSNGNGNATDRGAGNGSDRSSGNAPDRDAGGNGGDNSQESEAKRGENADNDGQGGSDGSSGGSGNDNSGGGSGNDNSGGGSGNDNTGDDSGNGNSGSDSGSGNPGDGSGNDNPGGGNSGNGQPNS
jgi:hypothetical protein